ncbi:unnamed protein product [Brugia pahangi]|uniref:Col_cuticle_N domain-containing protein n=1 Tax=Brugia pahangi TaxID=6280 RepID=A0A0N4T3B6_BRUPA|nr:unnamed protein product [Brugia pahangi]
MKLIRHRRSKISDPSRNIREAFNNNHKCRCPPGQKGEPGIPGSIHSKQTLRRQLRSFGFLYTPSGHAIQLRGISGPPGPPVCCCVLSHPFFVVFLMFLFLFVQLLLPLLLVNKRLFHLNDISVFF